MTPFIVFGAKYLFIFVLLGLGVAWLMASRDVKLRFLVSVILAGIIALVVSRIASHLYFDPRPFVAQHLPPLIPHSADNGFPSDHALLTMTLTAITYFFSKRSALSMLVLTVLVGLARVLALLHSPLDIVGGWLIGISGAVIAYYLARYIFNNYQKSHET